MDAITCATLVIVSFLAWDCVRRYLAARHDRLEAIRAELAAHKDLHDRALKEMAGQLEMFSAEVRSRLSATSDKVTTLQKKRGMY